MILPPIIIKVVALKFFTESIRFETFVVISIVGLGSDVWVVVRGLSMPGSAVWVDGSGAYWYGNVVIYVFNGLGKNRSYLFKSFRTCSSPFNPFQTCSFPFRLIIKFLFGARVRFFIHELFIEIMVLFGGCSLCYISCEIVQLFKKVSILSNSVENAQNYPKTANAKFFGKIGENKKIFWGIFWRRFLRKDRWNWTSVWHQPVYYFHRVNLIDII